jgi:lia operon protein LiaG
MHRRSSLRPWILRALAGVAGLVLAAGPAHARLQEPERFAFSDDQIAIYNLVGRVQVEGGAGPNVVVEVVRGGRDASQLRIETGKVGGRRALRVIYPANRVVYPELGRGSQTTLRVRADGTFGGEGLGGDRVTLAGSGPGLEAHADIRVRVPAGREVAVYLGAGRAVAANVDGRILLDTRSAPVEASGTRGWLRIDTGSGAVRVTDAEGEVEVDTGSGRVEIDRIRGTRLYVDTGSGAVRGEELAVAELRIDTGSGAIQLGRVAAEDVRLDTGSGAVRLELQTNPRSLDIDTGSGSVTLVVPTSLDAQLELDTGSGGIDVDLPLQVARRQRNYLLARAGQGTGSIRVDTGSGRIQVRAH